MSKSKKIGEILNKVSTTNVEFSKDISTESDLNANLHPIAKDEINKVKEFYDSKI